MSFERTKNEGTFVQGCWDVGVVGVVGDWLGLMLTLGESLGFELGDVDGSSLGP